MSKWFEEPSEGISQNVRWNQAQAVEDKVPSPLNEPPPLATYGTPPCGNLDRFLQELGTGSSTEKHPLPHRPIEPKSSVTVAKNDKMDDPLVHPVSQDKAVVKTDNEWGIFSFLKGIWDWFTGAKDDETLENEFPELTPEKKAQIKEIFEQTKEIFKTLAEEQDDDDLVRLTDFVIDAYKTRQELRDLIAKGNTQEYQLKREKWLRARHKQQEEFNHMIESASQKTFWHKLGIASAAIATCLGALSLPPGWNVAVMGVAAALALDELFDNPVKSNLANLLADGDSDKKKTFEQGLQFVSFVASCGLSIPTFGGTQGLALALGISQGVAGFGKTSLDWRVNEHRARLNELRLEIFQWSEKLNNQTEKLQKVYKEELDDLKYIRKMLAQEAEMGRYLAGGN